MNNKQKGMLLGSFVADSLALGGHWVYDTDIIDNTYGRVTELSDPIAKNFHPNRRAGEFTHYGDQMLLFYNYLRQSGKLNTADYLNIWKDFYDSYDGYKDHAMQDTRKNLEQGITPFGSSSSDLSGVFYVPVLSAASENSNYEVDVNAAVRMTHNNDTVIQAAAFLAEILKYVMRGERPSAAVEKAADGEFLSSEVKSLIKSGIKSIGEDTRTTIAEFGQSCPADYGLPAVVHLIGTYENDLETGLIENVMAGGDSAARGIFAGAVLGSHNGVDKIPERWMKDLVAEVTIN